MKYRFQVHLDVGRINERWEYVHPNGRQNEPYTYVTRREAEDMARMCYGNDPSLVRVVEIEDGMDI
jgi:hypothetical protein